MRGRRLLVVPVILCIAGVGLWHERQRLAQWMYAVQAPAIPAAQPVDAFVPAQPPLVDTARPVSSTAPRPPVKTPSTTPVVVVPPVAKPTPPATINLAVPFTTQAPFAVWEQPYEDGCEEASAAMVEYYLTKKTFTDRSAADAELRRLFAWEDATFGTNKDSTAAETARMIREYYGREKVVVKTHITAADIRAELAAGRPVIVPAYGKALKNPNFKNGGPLYHMVVIKGYIGDTHFITNDPGTRNGADYTYTTAVLMGALHDWNGGDVQNGVPTMIVAYP